MTQPTGGLGRHAGRAFRLSAKAAAMNRAFASEEKFISSRPLGSHFRFQLPGLFVIGTNRTGSVLNVSVPVTVRRKISSSWDTVPTGIAIKPPIFSCSSKAGGTFSGAAVTMIRSYGACSGHPK